MNIHLNLTKPPKFSLESNFCKGSRGTMGYVLVMDKLTCTEIPSHIPLHQPEGAAPTLFYSQLERPARKTPGMKPHWSSQKLNGYTSWNKALFPRKWDFIQVSIGHFCHNCPLSLRELHTNLMVQIGPLTRHVENPFYRWWQRWWALHHLHIPVSKNHDSLDDVHEVQWGQRKILPLSFRPQALLARDSRSR